MIFSVSILVTALYGYRPWEAKDEVAVDTIPHSSFTNSPDDAMVLLPTHPGRSWGSNIHRVRNREQNASHATWYSHSFLGRLISVLNVNMGRKLIERKVDLTGEFFISTLLNLYFQCMSNINLCTLSCLCLAQSEVPREQPVDYSICL